MTLLTNPTSPTGRPLSSVGTVGRRRPGDDSPAAPWHDEGTRRLSLPPDREASGVDRPPRATGDREGHRLPGPLPDGHGQRETKAEGTTGDVTRERPRRFGVFGPVGQGTDSRRLSVPRNRGSRRLHRTSEVLRWFRPGTPVWDCSGPGRLTPVT